jgi:hypothetical protein
MAEVLPLLNFKFQNSTRTVPIFESDDPLSFENCRLISTVKSLSIMVEKIISINLANYIKLNKIIHPRQYGFQGGKSRELNLLPEVIHTGIALKEGEKKKTSNMSLFGSRTFNFKLGNL